MKCTKCNNLISDSCKFCPYCGSKNYYKIKRAIKVCLFVLVVGILVISPFVDLQKYETQRIKKEKEDAKIKSSMQLNANIVKIYRDELQKMEDLSIQKETAMNNIDVSTTSLRSNAYTIEFTATVTNNTDNILSFVFYVDLYDKNDVKLGTEKIFWPDVLYPGETQTQTDILSNYYGDIIHSYQAKIGDVYIGSK